MSNLGSKVKSFFQNMVKPPPANVVLAAATATVRSGKPHVPLIRFGRSGDEAGGHSHPTSAGAGAVSLQQPSSNTKPNARTPLPVIEDWQLPHRLRRRPLSNEEIAYINRGGPE